MPAIRVILYLSIVDALQPDLAVIYRHIIITRYRYKYQASYRLYKARSENLANFIVFRGLLDDPIRPSTKPRGLNSYKVYYL